jgi:hypothetical protein
MATFITIGYGDRAGYDRTGTRLTATTQTWRNAA